MLDEEAVAVTANTEAEAKQQATLILKARQYKQLNNVRPLNRHEIIVKRSAEKTIRHFREENSGLKAKVWVAQGRTYQRQDDEMLEMVRGHVACQESLTDDIQRLKKDIANLDRQNLKVTREVYALNMQTISDGQHLEKVARVRKCYLLVMDQLDTNVKRECMCQAKNASLREQIISLLHRRGVFNAQWRKLIEALHGGKSYLEDLAIYASNSLDAATHLYEQIQTGRKREARDQEHRKVEMQEALRNADKADEENLLMTGKNKQREMAKLEPREYKRREIFRQFHNYHIELFTEVLQQFNNYYGSNMSIEDVIQKFKEEESKYHSYFYYTTELGHHFTLLNNRINTLHKNITKLKTKNLSKLETQINKLDSLGKSLETETDTAALKISQRDKLDAKVAAMLQGFNKMLEIVGADYTPTKSILGHRAITTFNMKTFLLLLESKLNEVLARVYITQKRERRKTKVVRDLAKFVDLPTDLSEIVLTQQCPECLATTELNPYDTELVEPASGATAKRALHERVTEPDFMYILHGLETCRLPVSRILALKQTEGRV